MAAVRNSFAEMVHQYDEYLNKSPAGRAANAAEFVAARLAALSSDLEQERQERKVADEKAMEYTKKQDIKNFRLSVFATICGAVGAISGIVALIVSFFK